MMSYKPNQKKDVLDEEGVMPRSLRFNQHSVVKDLPRLCVYAPADKASILPSTSFKVVLPRDYLLAGSNQPVRMRCYATATGTGGTYIRFINNIASALFNRITIKIGHTTVQDIDNFNVINNLFTEMQLTSDWASNAGVLAGHQGVSARNTASAGKYYEFELHIMRLMGSLLPTYLRSQEITLEFFTNPATSALETDKTSPTYTVTDFEAICDCIYLHDQKRIEAVSNNLVIPYESYKVQSQTIASGLTSYNVKLNANFKNLQGLAVVFLIDGDLADMTANDRFETFQKDNLKSMVVKINGQRQVHRESIDFSKSQGYYEMLKFFGNKPHDRVLGGTYAQFNADDKFVSCLDFSPVHHNPQHENDTPIVGGGIQVDAGTMSLELQWSSATPAQLQAYIVYKIGSCLYYQDNKVTWSE
jgi:hypothetical protein